MKPATTRALVIHSNAERTCAGGLERLEPVAGRHKWTGKLPPAVFSHQTSTIDLLPVS
jgi:hypothetical protein